MKNTVKKILSAALCALLAVSASACSSTDGQASGFQGSSQAAGGEQYKVGIVQFATHPSLDNCYQGFVEGLAESGLVEGENLTIDFQNAQNDTANSDMIAKNMVSSKVDLICGIATPSAMSAYSAAKDTEIPVVFTAVSDAVSAGIVKSNEKPGNNCTGSSDILPLDQQVKMIRAFLPEAKKIGVLYTTSEPNSVSQLERLKPLAEAEGFEVVEVGITNASEVAAGAATLISKGVDCINNFTDNNVVDNLSMVLQAANEAKIPVFGSEVEQVKNGCLASQSIDYVELGKETGKMAAQILKGEAKASEMPVFLVEECKPVYNKEVCDALGLSLPEEYADAEAVEAAEK